MKKSLVIEDGDFISSTVVRYLYVGKNFALELNSRGIRH